MKTPETQGSVWVLAAKVWGEELKEQWTHRSNPAPVLGVQEGISNAMITQARSTIWNCCPYKYADVL